MTDAERDALLLELRDGQERILEILRGLAVRLRATDRSPTR